MVSPTIFPSSYRPFLGLHLRFACASRLSRVERLRGTTCILRSFPLAVVGSGLNGAGVASGSPSGSRA